MTYLILLGSAEGPDTGVFQQLDNVLTLLCLLENLDYHPQRAAWLQSVTLPGYRVLHNECCLILTRS